MTVDGLNNSVFEMNVSGYMLEHSEGELFSSDWLKGEVQITKDGSIIERTLDLLILEEIEQLKEWLIMTDDYENCPKRFSFLDREIGCILHKRGGQKWVKWIIRVNENEREFIDMHCEKEVLENILGQLEEILNNYPCRCGNPHLKLVKSSAPIPFGLCYDEYPDVYSLGLVPRIFKGGYKDEEELIAGNLYSWLHQTRKILWDVDFNRSKITFYTAAITRLGRRLATLEKIDQNIGERIMMELVYLLSFKEVNRKDGNSESDPFFYQEVIREIDDQQMKSMLMRFAKMFVEQ